MGKKILFATLCLTLLSLLPVRAAAEVLVVVSDRAMPYSGEPGSATEGYAVEILRAVFEPRGFEIRHKERPWNRAVEEVRSGSADILIGGTPSETTDFIYPKQSLGKAEFCFFTNQPDWKFTGPASLESVRTGYVRGYSYPEWLLKEIKDHPQRFHALHGEDAFSRMLGMLKENRVQVVPGARVVAEYYIREGGLQDQVRFAGCNYADSQDLYFALSPINPPRSMLLADILDRGVETLRNTGQLNHLLIKYGLKDWMKAR